MSDFAEDVSDQSCPPSAAERPSQDGTGGTCETPDVQQPHSDRTSETLDVRRPRSDRTSETLDVRRPRSDSRWERCFYEEFNRLTITKMSKWGLDDAECCSFIEYMKVRIPRHMTANNLRFCELQELNLGDNKIGDVGVQMLVAGALECGIGIQKLYLHKNCIDQAGGQAVAQFIKSSTIPIAELHLSHNYLGPADCLALLLAAALRREYPLRGTMPLWLRLERQAVSHKWGGFTKDVATCYVRMQGMLKLAEERLHDARVREGLIPEGKEECLICQVEYYQTCKPFLCCKRNKPAIHVPYFWQQGESARSPNNDHWTLQMQTMLQRRNPIESAPAASFPVGTNSKSKLEPQVLYESRRIMVLSKGPNWDCGFDAYKAEGQRIQRYRLDFYWDRRTPEQIVNSSQKEYLDVFLARKYEDEMAWAWWDWHKRVSTGGEPSDPYACGAGLAHRLDIDTSGILLRAKTKDAWGDLSQQIRRRSVSKVYLALAHGFMKVGTEKRITAPLAVSKEDRYTYVDPRNGEVAETHLRCLANLTSKDAYTSDQEHFSLFHIKIVTGRTHQIRAHMLHINYPLVSDKKYNPLIFASDERWCPRIFLHAFQASFYDEGPQEVRAPLPKDLEQALGRLELGDHDPDSFTLSVGPPRRSLREWPKASARCSAPASASTSSTRSSMDDGTQAKELATLLDLVVEALRTSSKLDDLAKKMNIRWRLRALNCGGEGARDVQHLVAFAKTKPHILKLDEKLGTLELWAHPPVCYAPFGNNEASKSGTR